MLFRSACGAPLSFTLAVSPLMIESPITAAFIEASSLLDFEFVPSYEARLPNGRTVKSLGLVCEFGAENGTMLFAESSPPSKDDLQSLKKFGYFYSLLFPSYYTYNEAHFKDTLNDWHFYGTEARTPSWYTGAQWGTKTQ
mgnify:CR=1 FL=1